MIITVDLSLIKLKNFSISLFSIILLLFCSCYSNKRNVYRNDSSNPDVLNKTNSSEINNKKSPKAPWEIWKVSQTKNTDFKRALRLISDGELELASEALNNALNISSSKEEEELIVLNICSTNLKLGESKKALECISKYANKRQKTALELDSRFSLLASYAYLSINDTAQTFAWLSQTKKNSLNNDEISNEAKKLSIQYIRSLDNKSLGKVSTVWKDEEFISSQILGEKTRRLQGGSISSLASVMTWFDKSTYLIDTTSYVPDQNKDTDNTSNKHTVTTKDIANLRFGALLPLTGPYSTHGKHVREGIELALSEAGINSPLVVKDSNTGVLSQYESLVINDKVSLVFGPMVAKDAEEVTEIINKFSVPCISFAKKSGIPNIEKGMFRIGGTPENQLNELIKFSKSKVSINSIALIVSGEEIGQEYRQAFQFLSNEYQDIKLESYIYEPRNLKNIETLVDKIKIDNFDAVIISDTLPQIEPLIRSLKEKYENEKLPLLLGTSLLSDPNKNKMYSNLVNDLFVVSLYDTSSNDTYQLKFRASFREKFSHEPDLLAAQAYDATKFSINSLNVNNLNVLDSLKSAPDLVGVTGNLSLLNNGEIYRKLPILKIENGNFIVAR